jgi:uncharacterized protein YhaN
MRLERLQIPAFGPFTDLDLRFPAAGGDLHVIHGPNEAGKSSLLRAIRDLLFGIHGHSPDNFLHDYKQLRIRGEIVSRAGVKLAFQRRKGNKNTLLDADGHPLPDHALAPFLGSVDQAYFTTMFGLGARELREGAEQLLRGEGAMGQALFSASMGGAPVQRVLAALTEEAEGYYRGRATTGVSIRPAATAHRECLRRSREAAVSPEAWEKIERDLGEAWREKAQLEAGLQGILRELEWISRCEDALPTVGRLGEETRNLEALPPLPEVSSDFVERARAARKTLADAQAEAQRLTVLVARLEDQLSQCRTSPAFLEREETLERLHRDLGVFGDRKNEMVDLETELTGLEAALRVGMGKLELTGGLAALETLRLGTAPRLAFEEAAASLHKAREERDKHGTKGDEIQRQVETLEAELKSFPEIDPTGLRDALAAAAAATDADKTLPAAESEVKRLEREVLDIHRRLAGATEDPERTAGLPVPGKQAIRRLGGDMEKIGGEIKGQEDRMCEDRKRLDAVRAELARLERRGGLPSEEALSAARKHRDHGWSLVLADWKGGGAREELTPGLPLEEAFPQAMAEADTIADRLREEADAVAQAEEKRFQMSELERHMGEAREALGSLKAVLGERRQEWAALWQHCGIQPATPGEMEEWRDVWAELQDRLRQLGKAREAVLEKSSQVEQAVRLLSGVLGEPGEKGFRILFERARHRIQQEEEKAGQRIQIGKQLRTLGSRLEAHHQKGARLEQAAETALEHWKTQCRAVGLPADVSPQSGLALLREREDLLAKFDAWRKSSARRDKILQAVHHYEGEVAELSLPLGIEGDTTEARVSRLWTALTRAREAQTRHEQLVGQVQEARESLESQRKVSAQATRAFEELVRQARIETAGELEPLLAGLETRDRSRAQIATLRETLIGLARGQTVDDFLARLGEEDADSLPDRKVLLQGQRQEKEAALQAVLDRAYALKAERHKLEASGDAAAHHRQQAELLAARLKQDASRYVRLRLAAHFLQTQIERFRKENQGPLLERSGEVFRRITRGAFSGLGAEFSADDTPVLVGLRPDGASVAVSGMSDGTRDQLYLALRLAALDRYLEQHEPMPLILDDLLITFDDDRAAAILLELAEQARRTQILLFTHHAHLVDLCRRSLGESGLHLHHLRIAAFASCS